MMVTPDVSFKHVGVHHPVEDDRKKAAVNASHASGVAIGLIGPNTIFPS
jgi:hypothetical protein